MSSYTNPLITNVTDCFNGLAQDGVRHTLNTSGFWPRPVNRIWNHVQGFVRYRDFILMSYNDPYYKTPMGVLVIFDKTQNDVVHVVHLPHHPQYPHPGGMQLIGDFLVVPIETPHDQPHMSKILFYDLSQMTRKTPPAWRDDLTIQRPRHRTGAVGMTNWLNDGDLTYVIAAYDNGQTALFLAEADFFTGGPPATKFADTRLADDGYSSINLLTDEEQGKWIVGFRQTDDGHEDWADLYHFSVFRHTPFPPHLKPETKRHFFYKEGWCQWVGFRYGAGLSINADDPENVDFAFYATDRNPVFGEINYNRFDPAPAG